MKKYVVPAIVACTLAVVISAFAEAKGKKANAFSVDFDKIMKATGASDWEILSKHNNQNITIGNRTVETFRVVSVCRIPANQQSKMATAIEEEIDRQLRDAGAIQKGEWSANRAMQTNKYGSKESIAVVAPRLTFATDKGFGVLDLGVTAHNGHVTVVLSCTQ